MTNKQQIFTLNRELFEWRNRHVLFHLKECVLFVIIITLVMSLSLLLTRERVCTHTNTHSTTVWRPAVSMSVNINTGNRQISVWMTPNLCLHCKHHKIFFKRMIQLWWIKRFFKTKQKKTSRKVLQEKKSNVRFSWRFSPSSIWLAFQRRNCSKKVSY